MRRICFKERKRSRAVLSAAALVLFAAGVFAAMIPVICGGADSRPDTGRGMSDGNAAGKTADGEGNIYENVLRLHILAESDSDEDQAVKLKVRDEILGVTEKLLCGCRNVDEAIGTVRKNEEALLAAARKVLAQENMTYGASMTVGRETYPDRDYGGVIYPAGEYNSVRILLGSGEGHNWWCVLFPSLCLTPAVPDKDTEKETEKSRDIIDPADTAKGKAGTEVAVADIGTDAVEVGLTPAEYRVITGTENRKFKLRFRFLELFREWLD